MKVTLNGISYKGKYFDEVVVDIPQVENLEHSDAQWMITYFITKELGRMV